MSATALKATAIAHRFFDAVQDSDEVEIRQLTTSDAVLWQNFDNAEKPFESRIAGLVKMGSAVPGFAYADRKYFEVAEGAVLQHRIAGTGQEGSDVSVPIMVRIVVADGRIQRFEEYLDRGNLDPLYRAFGG